jgi:hypothetical protein
LHSVGYLISRNAGKPEAWEVVLGRGGEKVHVPHPTLFRLGEKSVNQLAAQPTPTPFWADAD